MMKIFSLKSLRGALLLSSILLLYGNACAANFVVDGIAYDSCAVDGDSKALCVVLPDEGKYYAGDIVIPQKVQYDGKEYHVVSFASYQLWDNELLTSVTINAEVTEIPSEFFSECTSLKQVTLPTTLTTISESMFSGCTSLSKVIMNGVETISPRAFEGCTSLTSFSIPSSVTFVASDALYGCTNIAVLRIEDGTDSINFSTYGDEGLQIESLYLGRNMLNDDYWQQWNGLNGLLNEATALKTLEFGSFVTRIPNAAFYNCTNLKNVVMGENITTIGYGAFANCSSLESITLGDSVKEIEGAFYNSGLKSIVIPDRVEITGGGTFRDCDSLSFVKLPDNLRVIGSGCFQGCKSLTSIILPEKLDSIGGYAFCDCGLTDSITFPQSVRYIGPLAFSSCKFSAVRMGVGVKAIADGAFEDCYKMRRFYYDGTIGDWCGIDFAPGCGSAGEIIGYNILYQDTPLYYVREFRVNGDTAIVTDIVIPDSIKKIPTNAFADYRTLKSVIIPATVDTVCYGAFYRSYGNNGIEKVMVAAKEVCRNAFGEVNELHLTTDVSHLDNNAIRSVDNLYYSGTLERFCGIREEFGRERSFYDENEEEWIYFSGGSSIGNVKNLYIQDKLITDLSIPSMEKLYAGIFKNFTGLKSVSLPSNVREIGRYAFYGCSSLQKVNYHQVSDNASSSQITLDDCAFASCSNLETVYLPASYIKILGASAFEYCSNLASVTCTEQLASSAKNTRTTSAEEEGLEIGDYCFHGDSLLYDMSFLDTSNVESIGVDAFDGTGWLNSLSDGAVYFGSCLFSYKGEAPANTILEIIDGTKTICSNALNGQAGIIAITFPNTLRRINSYAFKGTNITTLTIPPFVEKVSKSAFSLADSLTTLKFADGETPIYITDAGTYSPYLGLYYIKSLYIGRTAEWYEKPENFSDVVGLYTSTLDNLVIGATVNHINHSFICDSLADITVMNTNPPTSAYDFSWEAENGCTLHVPASAVEAYKTTSPWSAFFNIIGESDEALGIEYHATEDIDHPDAIHYDISGIRVSPKAKGLHIVKSKNGTSKKIFVM